MKTFVYHIWKSWPRYYCKNMENFLIFHIWKFPYEIWNSLHFTSEIWPHIIIWNITCSLYHSHKSLLKFSYMKDWNLCTSHMKIHLHMKSRILYTSDTRICAAILLHKIFNSVIFHNWKIMVAILLNYIPNSVYVIYENPDADFSPWYIEFFDISLYKNLDAIILSKMWNSLYIAYEYLGGDFLKWNMELPIFHIWKPWHWFSSDTESHYGIGIISTLQMKIWSPLFLQEIWNSFYFSNIYQGNKFPPWNTENSVFPVSKSQS